MSFIDNCLSSGFLVSSTLKGREAMDFGKFQEFINTLKDKPQIIDDVLLKQFDEFLNSFFEKKIEDNIKVDVTVKQFREKDIHKVEVIKNYPLNNKTRNMTDWFDYYVSRYNSMRKLLEFRTELRNATSIASIMKMAGRNQVSTIGLVKDIKKTHNNNYIIDIEDPTGVMSTILSGEKDNLKKLAEELVHDEVVGIVGSVSNKRIFISDIISPDVPEKETITSPVEEYACFIADTHIGSVNFEKEMYDNFVSWLKGNSGSEDNKNVAKKVKYLFVIGDLVDGVGVYPGQEKELKITDIYKQYELFADYLKDLPSDIQLVFIPGNHDAIRQSEPQPPLFNDIAKPVFNLSNVNNLSNPSMVSIGGMDDFRGLNVLMYHGFSYTYYASTVQKLIPIGMDKPDNVGEFLLRKRHLAPSHASGLITPEAFDPLVIDTIPDVLVSGHIHTLGHRKYKSTNIIATSCFQKMTSFMQKLGHHPTPGFVPLLNMKTRAVKVMNFT
ncbi:DNA polymerase II small subunit [Candidatus Tiddalikarchaeum anstoanum]|nr:DNA polymerase II small subunit [Candidatus Tiddalikarchaeum anstoanum]